MFTVMNKMHVFSACVFIGLICFSQEAYVSGMSAGGIGTRWYNLTVFGGISIAPARGYEDAVYGSLREEGDEFERQLAPLRDKFEKLVLDAKEKFDAPIVIYDPKMDGGYIDGVIIEDVMEFDPSSLSADLGEERRQETLAYEKKRFQRLLAEEPSKKAHFTHYFKKGSHINVEFNAYLPDDARYYQFSFTVNNRIKRSTLNWIRDQVNPDVIQALAIITSRDQ